MNRPSPHRRGRVEALLQFVPEPLRASVRANATQFTADDARWCRALLGRSADVLGPNVALTVAAITPTLGYEDVRLLIRFALWQYRLDDRQDDPGIGADALRSLQRTVTDVLAGRPSGADDLLLTVLAAHCRTLAARDTDGLVLARLLESVRDGLAAGVQHALLSRLVTAGRANAPTAEQYLELAVRHINYRCFALALVLVLGTAPDSAQTVPDEAELDLIESALLFGSLAVRLANDLRSQSRERAEGSLNVMGLCISELAPVRAESVRQRIAQAVRAHDALLAPLPVPWREPLIHCLRISVAVYGIGDLR